MPLDIVVGAQWGDEGKGRVTDLLAAEADIVARYSGGDNAGHTVKIGEEVFKLHLVPSGIVHQNVICLIGNGVVINPAVLLREIDELAARGVDVSPAKLRISRGAHLITPAHIALDGADEKTRGGSAIGTTLRGIGPAYCDKCGRRGLRAHLLETPDALSDAVHTHVAEHNRTLQQIYGADPLDPWAVARQFAAFGQRLASYLEDGPPFLHAALAEDQTILAEGAQGTFLDLDHGSYPFVTSSSPIAGGALIGLGVGPKVVRRVVGVAKAFTTRVGGGPFPCELSGQLALRLRGTGANPWDEYGTTTGRPRRVGWLDLVMLRHSAQVNGMTELALTKLDILGGLPEVPVCVAYELDGKMLEHWPADFESLERARPIYETLPGWDEDVTGMRRRSELPENAARYVDFVAEKIGAPIKIISVGPAREQTILD
jgi:adenylosuccinate synthase